MCVYVNGHYIYVGTRIGQRAWIPWNYRRIWATWQRCWGLNSGPQEQHSLSTTELTFWPVPRPPPLSRFHFVFHMQIILSFYNFFLKCHFMLSLKISFFKDLHWVLMFSNFSLMSSSWVPFFHIACLPGLTCFFMFNLQSCLYVCSPQCLIVRLDPVLIS